MTNIGRSWIQNYSGELLKQLLDYKGVPRSPLDNDEILRIRYFLPVEGFKVYLKSLLNPNEDLIIVQIDTHGYDFKLAVDYIDANFDTNEYTIQSITRWTYPYEPCEETNHEIH